MSNKDLNLAMVATLQDKGATVAARQISRAVEREAERSSRATTAAAERAAQGQERAMRRERDAASRMYQDRERLGIRSEQRIQREIALTEAAYRRLANSGTLSANEQSRALERTTQRVATLRRELAATNRQERSEGFLHRGLGLYQSGAAALMGAGYVLSKPIGQAVSYDMKLRTMANMAYSDRDTAGRVDGMREMQGVIAASIKSGGGSMDQAADALGGMLNEGAVSPAMAIKLLPLVNKIATSNPGTSSVDLGRIAGAMKQMGISDADMSAAFDQIVVAGQVGKVELKDLAGELPKAIQLARANGMSGMGSLNYILAAAETSALGAGTPGQAMTNIVDLLQNLKSPHTIRQAAMIPIAPGKGIDLIGSLNNLRATKGMNPLQAMTYIINKAVNFDPRYRKLKGEYDNTQDPQLRDSLKSQMDLVQGSIVGKFFPNLEAQTAMNTLLNNQPKLTENLTDIKNSQGANSKNFDLISDSPAYKIQQFNNEKQLGNYELYNGMTIKALGDLAQKAAELADKYPNFAAAVVGATTALNALAAAAGGLALVGFVRGKGVAGPGAAVIAREATAVEKTAGRFGILGEGMKSIGKGALGTGLFTLGMDATEIMLSNMPPEQKKAAMKKAGYDSVGAAGWGAIFGSIGSVAGPIGTTVGLGLGTIVGPFINQYLTEKIKDLTSRTSVENGGTALRRPEDLKDGLSKVGPGLLEMIGMRAAQPVKVVVEVQNGNIVASVKGELAREARRQ